MPVLSLCRFPDLNINFTTLSYMKHSSTEGPSIPPPLSFIIYFLNLSKKNSHQGAPDGASGVVDRIWKIALQIWNGISSSMVARAFLLAYRIMGKIIETKGDTDWLQNGAPHCHVRRDLSEYRCYGLTTL